MQGEHQAKEGPQRKHCFRDIEILAKSPGKLRAVVSKDVLPDANTDITLHHTTQELSETQRLRKAFV